jgi:hypothetical protein
VVRDLARRRPAGAPKPGVIMEISSDGFIIKCRCDTCGGDFEVSSRGYGPKRRPRKYCRPACKPSAQKRSKTIGQGRPSRAVHLRVRTITCPYCLKAFENDFGDRPNATYCSVECRYQQSLIREKEHRRSNPSQRKECAWCKVQFPQKRGNPIYCSRVCRIQAMNNRLSPVRSLQCRCCQQMFTHKGHGTPSTCSTACKKALSFVASNPLCSLTDARSAFASKEAAAGCSACGRGRVTMKDGRDGLVVDHCHQTGRIRGILCSNCNKIEGLASGDSRILRLLADWMDRTATLNEARPPSPLPGGGSGGL